MKSDLSFKNYAKYYDFLYQDKDYDRECDFVEEIFEFKRKVDENVWNMCIVAKAKGRNQKE